MSKTKLHNSNVVFSFVFYLFLCNTYQYKNSIIHVLTTCTLSKVAEDHHV